MVFNNAAADVSMEAVSEDRKGSQEQPWFPAVVVEGRNAGKLYDTTEGEA